MTNTAYEVEAINFRDKNIEFTKDLFDFYVVLFKDFGINRMVWNILKGNPAEPLYDRLTKNFGARIVGTFKEEVRLPDGKLYDLKYYELFKKDFFFKVKENEVSSETYREFIGGA